MSHIVVIGAGQAGSALVARLRSQGHAGPITLIGAEPAPPYQRPPLSKAYLMGQMEAERLWLRSNEFYAEQDITLRLGQPVTAIDPAAKTVTVGGETLSYDELALTTGSTPRRLPPPPSTASPHRDSLASLVQIQVAKRSGRERLKP